MSDVPSHAESATAAAQPTAAPMLEISELSAGYDSVPVVRGLSMTVRTGANIFRPDSEPSRT